MPTPMQPSSSAEAFATSVNGLHIQVRSMGQRIRGAGSVLHDVSLDVAPGRLTVIAGSSGAGKTILLQTLAGLRAPTEGTVLHDGAQPGPPGPEFGFVPQEDIIHRELPLRRTLVYAAGLRMPPGTTPESVGAGVDRVLEALGLSSRAATPVRALSGGERKRASIAAELLTRPRVLFLDEPTSGLDPVTGAALLRTLRALAEDGTTVVLTTHTLADLLRGDQVVFLSPDGEGRVRPANRARCAGRSGWARSRRCTRRWPGAYASSAPRRRRWRPEPIRRHLPCPSGVLVRCGNGRCSPVAVPRCSCTTGSRSPSLPVRR
ncbi:ATP-binding cassette domain-containing protein [Streptomyces sp. S1D4-11]